MMHSPGKTSWTCRILIAGWAAIGLADDVPPTWPDGLATDPINVFVAGTEGYHTFRIPAIVVSRKGTLLAFCEGRKSSRSDAGDIDLLLRRSTDLGKT